MAQTLARHFISSRHLTTSGFLLRKRTHFSSSAAANAIITRLIPSPPAGSTHLLRRRPLPFPLSHAVFRSGESSCTRYTAIRWSHSHSADIETEGEEEMAPPPTPAGYNDNNSQLQYWLVVMDELPGGDRLTQREMVAESVKEYLLPLFACNWAAKKKKIYTLDAYVCEDHTAFGCKIDAELAKKLEGMPGVVDVIRCNSEPTSDRADHSDSPIDSEFNNRQQLPYWIISMDRSQSEELTEQQQVHKSFMKLVPILDSLLNKYSLDIFTEEDGVAFGCELHEETVKELKGMPGVVDVIQSSRGYSEANYFELPVDSDSDEEMADAPLPQFPYSFSDIINNRRKHHWIIVKEKPRGKELTTDREMMEYSSETLLHAFSKGEEEVVPLTNLECTIYRGEDYFIFGVDIDDAIADKLKGCPGVLRVSRLDGREGFQAVKISSYDSAAKVKVYLKSEELEVFFTLVRHIRLTMG